jgi:hypothetical protein
MGNKMKQKHVKSTKGQYIGPIKTPDPAPTSEGEKKKKSKVKRRN